VKLRDRKMVGGGSSDYLPDLVPASGLRDRTRRMLDIVTAMAGLMLSAPILLIVSIAIKLHSPGPILSRKILYGYENRTIEVLKFRIHAEGENSRLTWLGCVVSQSGVDELLQLINVLRGEMSIFGRQNMPRWSPSIR
jgi:lipopolysaccharide/colanic/teichoic acid biosynthesis glycosyltransferase